MKPASGAAPRPRRTTAEQRAAVIAEISINSQRIAATLSTAAASGLTEGKKETRLSGRAHPKLVEAARARSGLEGSELLEYALAKVALEDDFVESLLSLRGTIGRDVDLGI